MAKKASAKKAQVEIGASTRILALYGPDRSQALSRIADLEAALSDAHGEVERFEIDGRHASLADVLDELRGYSLMQTHKLVVVNEAATFISNHRAALERYAQSPVDHAALVLMAEAWHRGKLDGFINACGAVIKCEPLKGAAAASWLAQRAKDFHQCTIKRDAAERLLSATAGDTQRADTELGRLAVMACLDVDPASLGKAGPEVTVDLIDRHVGRDSDELAWNLQGDLFGALASGRAAPVLEKIHELIDVARQPEIMVSYALVDVARKLAVGQAMQQAGAPRGEISKALKLWGPSEGGLHQALGRMKRGQGLEHLASAIEADQRAKSGLGTARSNVERVVVSMMD